MSRWADIHTFRYCGLRFDRVSGLAEFEFLHEGTEQQLRFTEGIEFPLPSAGVDKVDLERFHRVLELLYVAVGSAYYKAVAPAEVSIDAVTLAPAAGRWAEQLYREGLTEFAYRSELPHVLDLPVHTRVRAAAEVADHDANSGSAPGPPLVAFSGGKDSILALEVLTSGGFAPVTFTTERWPKPLVDRMVATAGVRSLRVRPRPDPVLRRLTQQKAARSGHLPLTVMTALVGAAVAALHGFGPVVLANERSADGENLVWRGRAVNHQWAKSAAAEAALQQALLEQVGLADGCFSLLRGMAELEICRLFASVGGYDELVSSCNVATRASSATHTDRWCNDCAKCRWVFLALAPFVARRRLLEMFGDDLLSNPAQLDGYRELAGVVGHKPFECVGEIAEVRVALELVAADPQWRDAAVVRTLVSEVPPVPAAVAARVRTIDRVPSVPRAYQQALDRWASALL